MADRYLLESGAPDGYTLEDGTGVLILEAAGATIVGAGLSGSPLLRRRALIGGAVVLAMLFIPQVPL